MSDNIDTTCDDANQSSIMKINIDDIQEAIDILKRYKTSGPDNIPAYFIKKCSKSLKHPILLLTSKSLVTGIVPDIWKQSYINPKKKEADFTDAKQSRPLSKINAMASIMEHIIYTKVEKIVITKLSDNQHGFIKNKSVITNLLQVSNNVLEALNLNTHLVAVYLDFLKAFDKVDHKLLIKKLHKMGIKGKLLAWIKSYLTNRSQRVLVNGFTSHPFTPTSGIPQGSRLGPLLFVIFINDLLELLNGLVNVVAYADDCKILKTINDHNDLETLQQTINLIVKWTIENKLPLNTEKCKYIIFSKNKIIKDLNLTINNRNIERVNTMRDLGVILDEKWTFHEQINSVIAKASKALGFVKRTTSEFTNIQVITYLYKALVLPHINYASIIWTPHTQEKYSKLDAIPRKFLRYAAYKMRNPMAYDNHNYTEISKICNVYTTKSLHMYFDISFVKGLLADNVNCLSLKLKYQSRHITYNIRSSSPIKEETTKNNLAYYAPVNRTIRRWNKLVAKFADTLSHEPTITTPTEEQTANKITKALIKKETLKLIT